MQKMKEITGNFLVSFRPGEVTGAHHEREAELGNVCASLGGFDCKVFDPYMAYSGLADAGLLVRVEEKSPSWFHAAGRGTVRPVGDSLGGFCP